MVKLNQPEVKQAYYTTPSQYFGVTPSKIVKIIQLVLTNLDVPLLAHGIYNTPLDGSPAGAADWDTHLVMAGQTVELSLQLSGISCQLLAVNGERK